MSKSAFLVLLFLSSMLQAVAPRGEQLGQIDIQRLRKTGKDWEVVTQETGPDRGTLRLRQDEWLMYFLHWRPLNEERRALSLESTRKLLLSFWGPNMPFTLTGAEGTTSVAGHPAFYVEGTIFKGAVRTRFIVWNCPETGRQFVADTNINLALGTNPDLLDLERESAFTVACHPQKLAAKSTRLKSTFHSEKYKLTFLVPDNWRTREYQDDKWFPTGMSDANGSLWTLPTDSEKHIVLAWARDDRPLDAALLSEFLERAISPVLGQGAGSQGPSEARVEKGKVQLDTAIAAKGCLVGRGSYDLEVHVRTITIRRPFVFEAFLWRDRGTTYLLLASLIALQDFWSRPNDLSPTAEVFNRFVQEEVLPSIEVPGRIRRCWIGP